MSHPHFLHQKRLAWKIYWFVVECCPLLLLFNFPECEQDQNKKFIVTLKNIFFSHAQNIKLHRISLELTN